MRLEKRQVPVGNGLQVPAVVAWPTSPAAPGHPVIVLAHGAGNDMHAPFLSAVHVGLAGHGYPAVKFNFPYTAQGRRAPDRGPVLEACYRHVLDAVRADPDLSARRIVIGGKSLGGRIASHVAAGGAPVAGVLLLGYPLHPAGKPDQLRTAHLGAIRVPMLFVAGTRDALCTLPLLQQTLAGLPAATTLHVVAGGDHSFDLPKRMGRTARSVWEEIVTVTVKWIAAGPGAAIA